MVIDDSAFRAGPPKSPFAYTRKDLDLAQPRDRAAAFVADMIFLLPVISLLASPFRKWYIEAQLFGDDSAVRRAIFLLIWGYMFGAILWMTTWIAMTGTTPGKKLLGLKVVDVWSRSKPRPMHAFLRACGMVVSLASLGIPFIAILTNPRRRPMHDRVSDTVVITNHPARRALGPSVNEFATGSALHVMGTGFLLLFMLVVTEHWLSAPTADAKIAQCKIIDEGVAHTKTSNAGQRLDVALALEVASLVNSNCLITEASKVLWVDQAKGNPAVVARAYLARGFAESSDDIKKKYFTKVCDQSKTDDACVIAKAELQALEGEPDKPTNAEFTPKTEFGRLWKMNHLYQDGEYSSLVDAKPMQSMFPLLTEYSESLRLQAIKRSGLKDETLKMAQTVFWRGSQATKTQIAKTVCSDYSGLSCSAEGQEICKWYIDQFPAEKGKLSDEQERILYHGQLCSLAKPAFTSETWAMVANWPTSKEELGATAYKKLRSLEGEKWPTWAGYEGRKLLLKKATPELLVLIQQEWEGLKKRRRNEMVNEVWEDLGGQIYERNRELGRYEAAYQIGLQIKTRRRANPTFMAEMERLAKSWEGARTPASKEAK